MLSRVAAINTEPRRFMKAGIINNLTSHFLLLNNFMVVLKLK
ncbi:hypothetical protein BH10BAC3_BH10BAC3_20450 [soil metagenome]